MPARLSTMLAILALAGCRHAATVGPPAIPPASQPAVVSAPPDRLPPGGVEPLSPGATPGTFRLARRVELSFAPGPPVPVDVAVETVVGTPVAAARLPARDGPATYSFDLRPGTYDLHLAP